MTARKNLLLFSSLILILAFITGCASGCASPEKLISKGEYEKLWNRSIKKALKGKPLKSQWLTGMEVSFKHLQFLDSQRVVLLFERNNKQAWNDILGLAQKVTQRQDRLQRVIPVYDKKGNRGKFQFIDVSPWRENARKNLTADYMQDALRQLNYAEKNGDRLAAKNAAYALEKAREHNRNIPQWGEYYERAVALATVRVNVKFGVSVGYFPDQRIFEEKLKDALSSMDIPFLDMDFSGKHKADYRLIIEPRDIVVTPQQEIVKEKSYEKEIVTDKKKEIKDTVYAEVKQVTQIKKADGQVLFLVYQDMQNKPRGDRIINARADFEHFYEIVDGDDRALAKKPESTEPIPFPSDFEMVARVHDALIAQILNHIEHWDWW